jgi:hypothetical protein
MNMSKILKCVFAIYKNFYTYMRVNSHRLHATFIPTAESRCSRMWVMVSLIWLKRGSPVCLWTGKTVYTFMSRPSDYQHYDYKAYVHVVLDVYKCNYLLINICPYTNFSCMQSIFDVHNLQIRSPIWLWRVLSPGT